MTDKKELDMTEHEKCIHYPICLVNNYIHKRCGYYLEEPKHGEWKWKFEYQGTHFRYGNVFCSECGYKAHENVPVIRLSGALWNFCPNCGADMRKEGEKNETDN